MEEINKKSFKKKAVDTLKINDFCEGDKKFALINVVWRYVHRYDLHSIKPFITKR
jgi:hypothetical protein